MTRIDVFDPPLCCSSGVCGPDVDPRLAAFAADVDWLTSQGVSVMRHNLAQEPQAFVANPVVQQALVNHGPACLPLVIVNGAIAGRGAYPRRDELARLAGISPAASRTKPRIRLSSSGGCCPPGSTECC